MADTEEALDIAVAVSWSDGTVFLIQLQALRRKGAICAVLGELYEKGPSGVRNEARAMELYKKVCDLGMKRACEKLQK